MDDIGFQPGLDSLFIFHLGLDNQFGTDLEIHCDSEFDFGCGVGFDSQFEFEFEPHSDFACVIILNLILNLIIHANWIMHFTKICI